MNRGESFLACTRYKFKLRGELQSRERDNCDTGAPDPAGTMYTISDDIGRDSFAIFTRFIGDIEKTGNSEVRFNKRVISTVNGCTIKKLKKNTYRLQVRNYRSTYRAFDNLHGYPGRSQTLKPMRHARRKEKDGGKWNKSGNLGNGKRRAGGTNESRPIIMKSREPYLPIESSHDRVRRTNVADLAPGRANGRPLDRRKGTRETSCSRRDRPLSYSDFRAGGRRPPSSLSHGVSPPPQPGNPRSRVHLIIIAAGAGGARCPLNRSSTTSAPPPRNYESLRAGFHRGENTHLRAGRSYTPVSPGATRQSAWRYLRGRSRGLGRRGSRAQVGKTVGAFWPSGMDNDDVITRRPEERGIEL